MFAGRDIVNPRAGYECAQEVYRQAGVTDPLHQFDCAEVYVPFSWFEPIWAENLGFAKPGDGWKLTADGTTTLGGKCPWNPATRCRRRARASR
jgi:acetyl-CoA C-acetyltransferase